MSLFLQLPSSIVAEIYSYDPTFHTVLQESLGTLKKRVAGKIAQRYLKTMGISPDAVGYFHFEYSFLLGNIRRKRLENHIVSIEELPSTVTHRCFQLTDRNKTTGTWNVYYIHFLFFEI